MYGVLYTSYNDDGSITYKLEGPYLWQTADLLVRYDDSDYDEAVVVKLEVQA